MRASTTCATWAALALFACGGSSGSPATVDDGAGGGGVGTGNASTGSKTQDDACLDKSTVGVWSHIADSPLGPPSWSSPEWQPVAYWTGRRMLLFSGNANVPVSVSAYDPCTDSWGASVKDPRSDPFSGVQGLVGATFVAFEPSDVPPGTHVRLDTATLTWTSMSTQGGPAKHAEIGEPYFLDDRLVVFGSAAGTAATSGLVYTDYAVGHRYVLAADAWSTTQVPTGMVPRTGHVHALAAGRLVVWGGAATSGELLDDGFVYDTASDQWRAMSAIGAPTARAGAVSVTTPAGELVVWRGYPSTNPLTSKPLADGAIYDAQTDAWRPMSQAGAPSFFDGGPVTAWPVGDKMLAVGESFVSGNSVDVAGLYDPKTNTWTTIDMTGAPRVVGSLRAAAYGTPSGGVLLVTDKARALFDPAADKWSALPAVGDPSKQSLVELWTGARLITWGQVLVQTGSCSPSNGQPCDPVDTYQYTTAGNAFRTP